jgi:hypothetical protein
MSCVSGEEFRDLIGRFATGITIVTTFHDDTQYGTTASAAAIVHIGRRRLTQRDVRPVINRRSARPVRSGQRNASQ